MKITIITAVFNNEKYIKDCIESVLTQTYHNIEYIIIDGASTDNTLKIINEYRDRITTIISEPDKGIYDALNKGLSLAKGDIIGFLHSDDLFYNDTTLQSIADTFVKNSCDGIYGDLLYVSKDNIDSVVRFWKSNQTNYKSFRHGWMPAHPTLFYKIDVYKKFGFFNTQLSISSDYDFILRSFGSGELKCIYIPQVITRMRVGGTSNKNIKNIINKSKEDYIALRSNKIGGIYTLLMKNIRKIGQFKIYC